MGCREEMRHPFFFSGVKGSKGLLKILLDFSEGLCMMELSKTEELVPAVRAISIYQDCRKTLLVEKPEATSSG